VPNLLFSVYGRVYDIDTLTIHFIAASGGYYNAGVEVLLSKPLSEAIFLVEKVTEYRALIQPKHTDNSIDLSDTTWT